MGDAGLDMMYGLVLESDRQWGEQAADFQLRDAHAIFSDERPHLHFLTRPRGGSKPLALDTPLPTPSGWTTMGAVCVGDWLLDENGHPTAVRHVGEVRLGEPCYRVEMAAGDSIVASADHEWVVEDRQIRANRGTDGLVTVTTAELRRGLRWGVRGDLRWGLPVGGAFSLPDADLPVPPYILGAWLGDGSSHSSRITVADSDRDELGAAFEMEGMPFVSALRKPGARCATWRFGNPMGTRSNGRGPSRYDAQMALRSLGVLGNKHVPTPYLRGSHKQRLALLRGLMDTDGHQKPASLSYFNTTSPALAEGVAELVVSLGWKVWRNEHRAVLNGRDCGPAYRVGFRADECPFNLARKAQRWSPPGKQAHRSENRTITAVEPVPSVPVRCIGVDSPSHLYLAGRSAVPTHNTTDLAGVALSWLAMEAPALSRGYVVASNSDQAAILIDAAAGFVARTPELESLTVENERIVAPNKAWVKVLSLSDSGAWGLRDARLLILDEFAQWPETRGAQRVYTAVRSTVQKTPGCRLVILTSAGEPSHWTYERVYQPAKTDPMWRVSETPGPVPWQDADDIEALRRELSPSEYARLVLNVWTEGEDRAVTEADYERAAEDCRPWGNAPPSIKGGGHRLHFPADNVRYIVTVDVGLVNDATVVTVAHKEPMTDDRHGPQQVVVDHIDRWQGSKNHHIPLEQVTRRVAELANEYRGARVYADPDQFMGSIQQLRKAGVRAESWAFTTTSVGQVATSLVQAFHNGQIRIPDYPELRDELLRVKLRESTAGVTRLDHDKGAHDDQAVCIGMACHLLVGGEQRSAGVWIAGHRRRAEKLADSADPEPTSPLVAHQASLGRRRRRAQRRSRPNHECSGSRCVVCAGVATGVAGR